MTPPVDLSLDAIQARQRASERTGRHGGWTGSELIDVAARNFQAATSAMERTRKWRAGAARDRFERESIERLLSAAAQIRLAQLCPLGRGYLHALDLEQIQRVKAEVERLFTLDAGALAVDTHRRIGAQRDRRRHAHEGELTA